MNSTNISDLYFPGPSGRSQKPARILLVGTHPDSISCRKNVVGEFTSPEVDSLMGKVLNEFGNVFNVHAHIFLIDANVSSSPSMKSFKTALSDFKSEIVDVSEGSGDFFSPHLPIQCSCTCCKRWRT